jgi:hypothetical protein
MQIMTLQSELNSKTEELGKIKGEINVLQRSTKNVKDELLKGIDVLINSHNLLKIDDLNMKIEDEKKKNKEMDEKIRLVEEKTQKIIKQKDLEYNLLRIDYVTNLENYSHSHIEKPRSEEVSTPSDKKKQKKIDNNFSNQSTTFNAPKTVTLTNTGFCEQVNRAQKKRKYVNNLESNQAPGRKEVHSAQAALNFLLIN